MDWAATKVLPTTVASNRAIVNNLVFIARDGLNGDERKYRISVKRVLLRQLAWLGISYSIQYYD
jgi:hypothetical protein